MQIYTSDNPYDIKAAKVVTKADKEYDSLRLNQFARNAGNESITNAKLSPTVIVYCNSEEQVINAVNFASQFGYAVVCRSGGHSYTGQSSTCLPRSMQIDLSGMNKIEVKDNNILEVGPGVILKQLNRVLIANKLSFPRGMCKGVGLGGHLQSSAYGLLTASHGSGMDHVLSFRIVLADGQVMTCSKDDPDPTFYNTILGSAPGSWGVITQYTIKAIADSEFPYSRLIIRKYLYSKEALIELIKVINYIAQDQEENNLQDIGITMIVGRSQSPFDLLPLPFSETLNKLVNYFYDGKVYISILMVWTGKNSGKFTSYWKNKYMPLFDRIKPLRFPQSFNLPFRLSFITSLSSTFKYEGYRYHIGLLTSDYRWSDDFIRILCDEFDDRTKMPDTFMVAQISASGGSSQFLKNAGMNALEWRNIKAHMDDWFFFKNKDDADSIAKRMRDFYARTKDYWAWKGGIIRYNWMTPQTIYDNATDLSDETVLQNYYPDKEKYHQLRKIKTILDPKNVFNHKGTIPPLPSDES